MTYSMAAIIISDHPNLAGRAIEGMAETLITALFIASKNSSPAEAKKIYEEMQLNGMDNKRALQKEGLLQKPLDVYVAGMQSHKMIFISLSLVAAHILPA